MKPDNRKNIVYLFILNDNDIGPLFHANAVLKYLNHNLFIIAKNPSNILIVKKNNYYKLKNYNRFQIFFLQIQSTFVLHKILQKHRINFFIIRAPIGFLLPFLYLYIRRKRIILEVNGLLFQDLIDRNRSKLFRNINYCIEKVIYRLVEKIEVVHENLIDPLVDRYKVRRAKFFIIENGTYPIKFSEIDEMKIKLKFSRKKCHIGYLGSLAYREGVDLLIKYFEKLDKRKYSLCIVGGDEKKYHKILKSYNISEETKKAIIYHPYMQFEKSLEHMQACDILVHLRRPLTGKTDSQGSPLKILDYLNVSRPIIATKISSYKFIEKEKFGLLINCYDFKSFYNSINTIYVNLSKFYSNRANVYIRENYTWEKQIAKLNNYLNRLWE